MAAPLDKETASIYQQAVADPRTPLCLRIGIAGSRKLSSQGQSQAEETLTQILSSITDVLQDFTGNHQTAKRLYQTEAGALPILRLTSSLAIGADRLITHPPMLAAIEEKALVEMAAVLPFIPEDCKLGYRDDSRDEATNEAEWSEFETILQRINNQAVARVLAIDGDVKTPESRDRAYYRCSEYLAENIDLLIIVTEGAPKPQAVTHLAGSAATIKQARDLGRPVIHIIVDPHEDVELVIYPPRNIVGQPKHTEWSESIAVELMEQLVLFKGVIQQSSSYTANLHDTSEERRHNLILNEFEHHITDRKFLSTDESRDTDFNYSGPIYTPVSWSEKLRGFKAFDWFKKLASRKNVHVHTTSQAVERARTVFNHKQSPSATRLTHQIYAYFLRADALAIRYAAIHRSTYLLIYLFAAAALITAAIAITFQDYDGLVAALIGAEATFLILIYWLYKQDHHNHRRWLQNRCLAEAIRPNIYLNPLGRCFSFMQARSSGEFLYREVLGHQESGAQWVCIQAELINRYVGFERCIYSQSTLHQSYSFITDRWLTGQIQYHQSNASVMQSIGERLSKATHALFFLTASALLLKAGLYIAEHYFDLPVKDTPVSYYLYKFSSLFTAAFPILGTAIFAIRNHSELDISEQRSRTMLAVLNSVLHNFNVNAASVFQQPNDDKLNKTTSVVFDPDIQRLSEVSIDEVSDWLEIYEVKESEPG
ncbi:hypothetical protein QTP81_10985 [Alteromonas sp. ASW11-36]|uniref:SMODS and SLOG-associating 2TM effector domain-containing protein n=1 Tax=Alteromonas arenosi TaxID=3055817 RepID=A0ABT7SZX8_9ALTE|nr:hypothetical protein [Alteromonas sp. ASW11-36]MDM7861122.1 hypothetical protein [Alteromonas sp. ASW11-36]